MRTRPALLATFKLTCVAALAGCAGNGTGLDSNGRPIDSSGQGVGELTADFQSIQDHVFTPICSVCHAGASAPQGLRLDATNSYDLLVGVPSNEVPSILRVKPGDPDHSYLVQKIEGHAAVGAQMPFGGPPLPDATIAVIRQWVTDGAQRSPAAAVMKPFAVAMTAPAQGDIVGAPLARVVIGFSNELDQTRIAAGAVRLERDAGDDASGAATDVDIRMTVPPGNPSVLTLAPSAPLGAGRYRLVASGASGASLSDLAGQSLAGGDGDITLATFTVDAQP